MLHLVLSLPPSEEEERGREAGLTVTRICHKAEVIRTRQRRLCCIAGSSKKQRTRTTSTAAICTPKGTERLRAPPDNYNDSGTLDCIISLSLCLSGSPELALNPPLLAPVAGDATLTLGLGRGAVIARLAEGTPRASPETFFWIGRPPVGVDHQHLVIFVDGCLLLSHVCKSVSVRHVCRGGPGC